MSHDADDIHPLFSVMAKFYDGINGFAKRLYHATFQRPSPVSAATARASMAALVEKLDRRPFALHRKPPQRPVALEDKLRTLGDWYVPPALFATLPSCVLWEAALAYDRRGIIPALQEDLQAFAFRANTLLYFHRKLRENHLTLALHAENDELELLLMPASAEDFVHHADVQKASERVPYYMELGWVTAYLKEPREMVTPALGITFTIPQYNGINFIHMRRQYKSREQFLDVLAHELTHAGTVFLDRRRDFLETKAYAVGKGDLLLGEYVVSLNANPGIILRATRAVFEYVLHIPIPDRYITIFAKVRNAVEVWQNTVTYRAVERELVRHYGRKGRYFLGRLNADEFEEFRDTNDIPGRIAMKEDLKWRIMRTNFTRL